MESMPGLGVVCAVGDVQSGTVILMSRYGPEWGFLYKFRQCPLVWGFRGLMVGVHAFLAFHVSIMGMALQRMATVEKYLDHHCHDQFGLCRQTYLTVWLKVLEFAIE